MYPKIPLSPTWSAFVVALAGAHCTALLTAMRSRWGSSTYHMLKNERTVRDGREKRSQGVRDVGRVVSYAEREERVVSNMQRERVDGMRGVKKRSVVAIFVSDQAKLAAIHSSPYLSPTSHDLLRTSRITRWRPAANHTTLSSCRACTQYIISCRVPSADTTATSPIHPEQDASYSQRRHGNPANQLRGGRGRCCS